MHISIFPKGALFASVRIDSHLGKESRHEVADHKVVVNNEIRCMQDGSYGPAAQPVLDDEMSHI